MKTLFLSTIFIFLFAVCAFGQNQCADLADCEAKLSEASRMINKLLDVSKAQTDAITALKEENAARARKNDIDAGVIAAQDKLILLLEKQTKRQISFFFGLVKVRY